ncbi:SLC13 family permease [Thermococcus sp. MAR1]|uniref:SLC13 family permease n=1 Tax=Thermococcus sp. MAR1 TaxID=1638263 RepID=UPI00143CA890|nr:SLC13 family permease [Thermococcus sp. MAR1]NJE10489.1 anion transporter [Thermococcus sp. MAR1]
MALYLVLALIDRSLPGRTPVLIDWGSLSLITALIITSKGLEISGIFSRLAPVLVRISGGSGRRLFFFLLPSIAFSSAVIMNDTAMLVFIPLVVAVSEFSELDGGRAVALSAIAANVGSSLTPVGNPQNVIIWREYGIGFVTFIIHMLPFVLLWMGILFVLVIFLPDENISPKPLPPISTRWDLLIASTLVLGMNIYLGETGRDITSLVITLMIFLIVDRRILWSFDWALVLTFALIFADFNEVSHLISGSARMFPGEGFKLLLASAGLSQLISNVPATVLFLGSKPEWLPLALGVNLGGTGMIIGSLANLIALRISGIGMRDFHRYSIPYFLIALGISILILLL